jgi:hypothetical protein
MVAAGFVVVMATDPVRTAAMAVARQSNEAGE